MNLNSESRPNKENDLQTKGGQPHHHHWQASLHIGMTKVFCNIMKISGNQGVSQNDSLFLLLLFLLGSDEVGASAALYARRIDWFDVCDHRGGEQLQRTGLRHFTGGGAVPRRLFPTSALLSTGPYQCC